MQGEVEKHARIPKLNGAHERKEHRRAALNIGISAGSMIPCQKDNLTWLLTGSIDSIYELSESRATRLFEV